MTSAEELGRRLERIDGRGYGEYKSLTGSYDFGDFELFVDHVQGDPFASPSRLRLRVSRSRARVPAHLAGNRIRRTALEDVLARRVRSLLPRGRRQGTGKSGLVNIDAGAQQVLERSAVVVTDAWVEARIEVGLPASGRTILGRAARRLLLEELPPIVRGGLVWSEESSAEGERFVDLVENQEHLRSQLDERGLVAFVADGARLPRASGISDEPLEDAVVFRAPASLRTSLSLLHPMSGRDRVTGLGVPRGVTLVVGGGYHGKSTLLRALERAVYPHVPDDGRELVVSRPDAVAIRAEDGRRIASVDISGFIRELPGGRPTEAFSTDNASGSTSQAANIVEALEAGAGLLLVDEDTSATNFMVRDARIQKLVSRRDEPIVPFVDRVRELYDQQSVSTVLVMGGSGDYFDVADTVIRMREYVPDDATAEARRIAADHPTRRAREADGSLRRPRPRRPSGATIDASAGTRRVKIDARGRDEIRFGRERIDLRAVAQLVDESQARAAGLALHYASVRLLGDGPTMADLLDQLEGTLDREGLDVLAPGGTRGEHPGNLARPRRFEIAAALNRLRSVAMESPR